MASSTAKEAIITLARLFETASQEEDWATAAQLHVAIGVLLQNQSVELTTAYQSLRSVMSMALPLITAQMISGESGAQAVQTPEKTDENVAQTAESVSLPQQETVELIETSAIHFLGESLRDYGYNRLFNFDTSPTKRKIFTYLFARLGAWCNDSDLISTTSVTESSYSSTKSRLIAELNKVSALQGVFNIEGRDDFSQGAKIRQHRLVLHPAYRLVPPNTIYRINVVK
jgi:hypothetical protein